MSKKSSRIFNGKIYYLSYVHRRKLDAQKLVKQLRSDGYYARMTYSKTYKIYNIWYREK